VLVLVLVLVLETREEFTDAIDRTGIVSVPEYEHEYEYEYEIGRSQLTSERQRAKG
jgi:hypothetical protein